METLNSNRRAVSTNHNNHIGVWEENTMAILDSSGIKDSRDVHDDRLCFLEAVRSASLASESPSAPSRRMFAAIFQILVDCNSLELAMSSYQLLTELDKCYPRVFLMKSDEPESSSSGVGELVVVKEAWSPFNLASGRGEGIDRDSCILFDSLRFSALIEDMVQTVNTLNFNLVVKPVGNLLLFQYLVNVLEEDLQPRLTLYKETMNWSPLKESALNILLGSRKLNFKSLVRHCMTILVKQCHHRVPNNLQHLRSSEDTCSQSIQDCNVAVAIAVSELEKETCVAVQKLFKLVMEIDVARKEADSHGLTSRLDGSRLPILDIIVDELTYNKDSLLPFLVVFSEPKWKLEIILQYFSKYLTKSSVRTRRSNDPPNNATLEGILSNFSNVANTKNIVKKVTSEAAQLLLAHAFQACLSLVHDHKQIANSAEKTGASLSEICNSVISAFRNLTKVDQGLGITPFAKEALFTAATLLKRNS